MIMCIKEKVPIPLIHYIFYMCIVSSSYVIGMSQGSLIVIKEKKEKMKQKVSL